jgi:hypothetical protein
MIRDTTIHGMAGIIDMLSAELHPSSPELATIFAGGHASSSDPSMHPIRTTKRKL